MKFFLPIIFLCLSCGSTKIDIHQFRNQQFGALYSDQEKERYTIEKAELNFKRGKSKVSNDLLQKAKKEYNFLVTHFDNEQAKKRLIEIDQFYLEYKQFYEELLKESVAKKLIFTSAGYYKKIQRLYPDHSEATNYLSHWKNEIKRRLQINLNLGTSYANKKKYNKAKRCFNRVLVFEPNSEKAKAGLKLIDRYKENDKKQLWLAKKRKEELARKKYLARLKRKSARKKKQSVKPVKKEVIAAEPEVVELSIEEKEELYAQGIDSYNNKDYKKAYEFFEQLKDSLFKDASLYLERSEDKITALGLDDE